MQTLTLQVLRTLVESGNAKNAILRAQGSDFFVWIRLTNGGEAVLAKARSTEARSFRDPLQALSILRPLGFTEVMMDITQWDKTQKSSRTRPDRTQALKDTYATVKFSQAILAEVEEGLLEANDPGTEWLSHEEVTQRAEQRRNALLARIKERK